MANKKTLDDLILEVLNEAKTETLSREYEMPLTKIQVHLNKFLTWSFDELVGALEGLITPSTSRWRKNIGEHTGLSSFSKYPKRYLTAPQKKKIEVLEELEKKISKEIADKTAISTTSESFKYLEANKTSLGPLPAASEREQERISLGDQSKTEPFTSGDIYTSKDILEKPLLALGLEKVAVDKILNTFHSELSKVLTDAQALASLKEVASNQIVNIDDIADLFYKKDLSPNLKKLKEEPEGLILALKKTYKAMMGKSYSNQPDESDNIKKTILTSIRSLIDGVRYYSSGKQIRTIRGALTGFTLGTAQASGEERIEQELYNTFSVASGGGSLDAKFEGLALFLDKANKISTGSANFGSQDISKTFGQFVSLEIMYQSFFKTVESTVKGNLFEAFLAMFVGGKQTGASLGAGDFVLPGGEEGSAKLLNSLKFEQSYNGLLNSTNGGKSLTYVVGVKSIRSKSGEKYTAGTKEKFQYIDIHLLKIKRRDPSSNTHNSLKAEAYKESSKSVAGAQGLKKTQTKFDFSSIQNDTYITTLDFSLFQEKEFEDVSSKILDKINSNVEKAFRSLVDMRDNISMWISKKDLIAANQVDYNRKDLDAAINGMKGEETLKTSALTENQNKSLKKLDKLIEQVILEHINK
jgi:hypothetical protein